MKHLRNLSATLLFIAFIWTLGAIHGASKGKILAIDALEIAMSGEFMLLVILILICFIFAIALDRRN